MCRKHILCFRIYHLVCISVVCGDANDAALCLNCFYYLAYTFVNCFHSFNCTFKYACVSYHIAVCKVKNYNVIFFTVNSLKNFLGNLGSTHFGLKVIGSNLGRSDKCTVLIFIRSFYAAIKEKCNVCIFFCFRYSKLSKTFSGNIFTKSVRKRFRLKCHVHIGHLSIVLGHTYIVYGEESVLSFKSVKFAVYQCAGNFTGTVGTEVKADNAVILAYSCTLSDDCGNNKFVRNAVIIGFLHSIYRIWVLFTLAINKCGIRLFHSFPAVISIHCIVSSRKNTDFTYTDFVKLFGKLFHKVNTAGGRNVSAVHKAMDINLCKSASLRHLNCGIKMCNMAVYTAVG